MPSLQLQFHPTYQCSDLQERILGIFSGDDQGVTEVESSHYARVLRFEMPIGNEKRAFYYKEFLFRGLRDRVSVLFRASRAQRAWTASRILLDHGLFTAFPVCIGQRRFLGVVTRSFLVTEAIPDALEIEAYIKRNYPAGDRERIADKRKFITHLGRVIGGMHRLGIFQGDLRERNILVQEGDPQKIYLIDNERTRLYKRIPDRKRLKNLVQMNMTRVSEITRADRARFFYSYLGENPDLVSEKKEWMSRVLRRTRARLIKKGRVKA